VTIASVEISSRERRIAWEQALPTACRPDPSGWMPPRRRRENDWADFNCRRIILRRFRDGQVQPVPAFREDPAL